MRAVTVAVGGLTLVAAVNSADAGTLCGTVRDAQTASTVPNAGVFVYLDNSYTGMYSATDAIGSFCIDPIADGTYDLQVRVDDHEATWVKGVVVSTTTSVDILTPMVAGLLPPWPNPASSRVNLRFETPVGTDMQLEVFDLRGRRVRAWGGPTTRSESQVSWDLTDFAGQRLAPGVYMVRLRAGNVLSTRRFVLVR